jgi:hypothetical protein
VTIEQAFTFGWERYIGTEGRIIGMQSFGHSVPLKALQQEFGFIVEHVGRRPGTAGQARQRSEGRTLRTFTRLDELPRWLGSNPPNTEPRIR